MGFVSFRLAVSCRLFARVSFFRLFPSARGPPLPIPRCSRLLRRRLLLLFLPPVLLCAAASIVFSLPSGGLRRRFVPLSASWRADVLLRWGGGFSAARCAFGGWLFAGWRHAGAPCPLDWLFSCVLSLGFAGRASNLTVLILGCAGGSCSFGVVLFVCSCLSCCWLLFARKGGALDAPRRQHLPWPMLLPWRLHPPPVCKG